MSREISRARVEALAIKLSSALKEHCLSAPLVDDTNVLEALNAFATVAAIILAATGNDRRAREFFERTVKQQVKKTVRDTAATHPDQAGNC